jgi:hypothetical protein
MTRIALEPFYLHREQVTALLGPQRAAVLGQRADGNRLTAYTLAAALAEALPHLGIGELQLAAQSGTVRPGMVTGVEQEFDFRRAEERDQAGDLPIDFHGSLSTERGMVVSGTLNAARLAASSSAGNIAGRSHAYIIGTVTALTAGSISLRPAFAGIRSYVEDDQSALFGISQPRRILPSEIDQFRLIDFASPCPSSDLKRLGGMAEKLVKHTIASLLGEPFVPLDWGGERSDLYSSRMFVGGSQVSSAWLLKGPGARGPMTIRSLGSRGDQIVRLFTEPADVLVIQHYREITTPVISMMEAHAHDSRNPRRFMILDGADTARILRAKGAFST